MKKRLCLQGCIYAEKRQVAFSPVWLRPYKPTPNIKLPTSECKNTRCETCYMKENMKHYVNYESDNCDIWETIERELNKDVYVFCKFEGKGVRKYLTECPHFANNRLFDTKLTPEYLPITPFEKLRECKVCKGKGFVVFKDYEPHYNLDGKRKQTFFTKEKCVECEGRGYIRKIPTKNLNDCVKS